MREWEDFGRARPRRTKGGIRAQSQRGGFARSWWGMRWMEVLEGLDIGKRLGRGKSYARGGQVRSIEISEGKIVASVQGSRPDPYGVLIRVQTLTPDAWAAVAQAIAGRTVFAARLLAGEMPEGIEDVFIAAGLSLFPRRSDDLMMECTCPDEANPCKHIAAVHYLLTEEFDRDPFLIFRLRGLAREDLSRLVIAGGGPDTRLSSPAPPVEIDHSDRAIAGGERLPSALRAFWGEIDTEAQGAGEAVRIPAVAAALPKRLGNFPFWRGERGFLTTLERIYSSASQVGMSVYLAEPDVEAEEAEPKGR